jgi:hypothetical protein
VHPVGKLGLTYAFGFKRLAYLLGDGCDIHGGKA